MSDFNTIESVLENLQAGKMVVLVDERAVDVDGTERVGEGELIMVAERATPDSINFLTRHAGGPLYVTSEKERLESLGLNAMLPGQEGPRGSTVMVTVNAAKLQAKMI